MSWSHPSEVLQNTCNILVMLKAINWTSRTFEYYSICHNLLDIVLRLGKEVENIHDTALDKFRKIIFLIKYTI
jgi:hypothetical protein